MPLAVRVGVGTERLTVGLRGDGTTLGGATGSSWAPNGAAWGGTQSGTANVSLPLTANTVATGDIVLCGMTVRGGATSVGIVDGTNGAGKDSLNNSWALLSGCTVTTGTFHMEVWASQIANPGTDTITWTWTTGAAASSAARRFTGGTLTLDGTAGTANAATSSLTTGALTTSFSRDLLFVYEAQSGNSAFTNPVFNPSGNAIAIPDTDFQTTGTNNSHCHFCFLTTTGTGAQSFTDSSGASSTWATILAALKHA